MLKKALGLLLHDPKGLRFRAKIKLLGCWCRLHSSTGFICQGRMDLDPRSWWHNPDFVASTGGYLLPGDPTPRKVLSIDPFDTVRRDMIILLLREVVVRQVEGDLAELGVFRGYSARVIHHYLPERPLYLFDTFAGFDARDLKVERTQTGLKQSPISFSQTGLARALRNIAPQNSNVQAFPGHFPDSAPSFLRDRRFAFVHLDADLYEPMLTGLEFFYDRVVPGGFILAHDFNAWPGSRKAVTEFFQDKPEVPIPMPDKSGSALVLKLPSRAGAKL